MNTAGEAEEVEAEAMAGEAGEAEAREAGEAEATEAGALEVEVEVEGKLSRR
jgi:hypothetical protein